MAKLSSTEAQTLLAWHGCSAGYGFGFEMAAGNCSTPRHGIRRAVRALARKGMLQYERMLFFEDENKMGAGYTLTEAGRALLDEMEDRHEN
ncbi:hypothetical protein IC614_02885 [Allosphingosinicella flava]|uniref:MarR family transcriptional regulator n=1 Tax=Allosphingosinicella flava TaxID=2771430 RepID=A0A7T2GKJ7_9SPHN|nr:hypothetical protein [Sphingosinicella flava]QPQ55564.1 hypothetical protein IC614_02885 [Sphingosinicella flava]